MIRKALIIGSPDEGKNHLPGVLQDMKNWRAYLSSIKGGAWNLDEITTIESPSPSALRIAVARLDSADYAFVTFSGHGRALPTGQTFIGITSRDEVDSSSLISRALRQTVVVDCCRSFPEQEVAKSFTEARNMAMDSYVDREAYRRAFDNYLRTCDFGQIILHSCSPNETAGESEQRGGYYSSSLIQAGAQSNLSTLGVLTVKEAHWKAQAAVESRTRGRQNPTGEFPRSKNIFPFAVAP
jgi:hypothetical protein